MNELAVRLQEVELSTSLDANGSLRLDTAAGPKLIKRFHRESLREQAFVVARQIPGLHVHQRSQLFEWGSELYQLIDLDPELAQVGDPRDALAVVQLYTCSDHIRMLAAKLTLDDLIRTHHINYHIPKRDGHPQAREISLDGFVDLFASTTRELWPQDEARFRTGLFHEDLQTSNILAGPDGLHLVDLDPIWHTYSVMNLAHFFVIEVIANRRVDLFDDLRKRLLSVLVEESARDFDFFVLLALYRILVRRAFHREFFAQSALQDFTWYFNQFGVDLYLERAAGRR